METITWSKERTGENWNKILNSSNPEKTFLDIFDKDYVWRCGYGFYGFKIDPTKETITFRLGSCCD